MTAPRMVQRGLGEQSPKDGWGIDANTGARISRTHSQIPPRCRQPLTHKRVRTSLRKNLHTSTFAVDTHAHACLQGLGEALNGDHRR